MNQFYTEINQFSFFYVSILCFNLMYISTSSYKSSPLLTLREKRPWDRSWYIYFLLYFYDLLFQIWVKQREMVTNCHTHILALFQCACDRQLHITISLSWKPFIVVVGLNNAKKVSGSIPIKILKIAIYECAPALTDSLIGI